MIKGLKVTMIVLGVVEICFGLGFLFFMPAMGAMLGFEQGPDYIQYVGALLGVTLIVISIFIIAAAKDPLRHIYWVKFAIWWSVAGVLAALYSMIMGYVHFGQAGMGTIWDAIVGAALLIFYPWRGAKESR
jgi:hypothetical protein